MSRQSTTWTTKQAKHVNSLTNDPGAKLHSPFRHRTIRELPLRVVQEVASI